MTPEQNELYKVLDDQYKVLMTIFDTYHTNKQVWYQVPNKIILFVDYSTDTYITFIQSYEAKKHAKNLGLPVKEFKGYEVESRDLIIKNKLKLI